MAGKAGEEPDKEEPKESVLDEPKEDEEEGEEGTEDEEEGEDEGEDKDEAKGKDEDEGEAGEDKLTTLASRLDKLEAGNRRLEMENVYLKGQLAAKDKKPKEEGEEDADDTDEVIADKLRKDPVGTLKAREARLVDRIVKAVDAKLSGHATRSQQMDADTKMLLQQYPEIETNKEFLQMADYIYNQLLEEVGSVPGLKTVAASTAYGQMVRQGKLMPGQPKGNGRALRQGTKETIREISKQIGDPLIKTKERGSGDDGKGDKGDPLAGFSKEDRKAILQACKDLDITTKQWVASYNEAKEAGEID